MTKRVKILTRALKNRHATACIYGSSINFITNGALSLRSYLIFAFWLYRLIKITEMQFVTPVALPLKELEITHNSRVMLIGSCFAGNIGKRMEERKFAIDTNPFGVQYNPFSIAAVLKRIASGTYFTPASPEIFEHNGLWHSIMHHSVFSRLTKEELLECINKSLEHSHSMAGRCDIVIVTFGTAYVYTRKSDGAIAGNCHKLPGKDFERRLLGTEEITEEFGEVIELYKSISPGVKFLFTISPIRHLRDGAHDNQKSKAALLLAVDRIISEHSGSCFYFPAYEILLDELRDYRFYAEDMLHPSETAANCIWEKFGNCYFSNSTQEINREIEGIIKGLSHRPFNAASDEHMQFLKKLREKMVDIQKRHNYLNLDNEIRQCDTQLKT